MPPDFFFFLPLFVRDRGLLLDLGVQKVSRLVGYTLPLIFTYYLPEFCFCGGSE